MMFKLFFEKIQDQWDARLPFVVYRKPKANHIVAFLQDDRSLYTSPNFKERGFVFAPFDAAEDAILIPDTRRLQTQHNSELPTQHNRGVRNEDQATDHQAAKTKYIDMIQNSMEQLHNGVLQKVVLSRKENQTLQGGSPLVIFQRLLNSYATAMVYCWYHPKVGLWLGATPETLLYTKGDHFYTMALAGTQAYKGSTKVQWGTKEQEEQAMVSREINTRLSGLVSQLECSEPYTDRAGTLLHLRTDIRGRILDNSLKSLINALHPTPAVCGLPRQNAMDFIRENEGYQRKFYTGFLGELNLGNTQDPVTTLFVNLRCMQLQGNTASIYVGGGVTKASVPEKEWEETLKKTSTMRVAL